MPKLIRKKIKARAQFDFENYSSAKEQLWNQVEAKPKRAPGDTDSEDFARKIDALAMHIAGMPMADAARANRMTPADLYAFKSRWLNKDSSLAPLLANMLEACAVGSLIIFNKKKDQMDASEAASAAATLTKSAVQLRTGQNTNYSPPENQALETLDRVARILELSDKKIKDAKVIDMK
jgi:hypothetical protein